MGIPKSSRNNPAITVVYDNNPHKEDLKCTWGFSALITGANKTILFDTGSGEALLDNMENLRIEPTDIDVVILSHIHGDHTGGLDSFLKKNSNITLYLPMSFPKQFKENLRDSGVEIVPVKAPLKICENVHTTGPLGRWIKEQSLIIRTNRGMIIINGCAHPGIIKIIDKAKSLFNDRILLVMGGFHLEWTTRAKIEKIISAFNRLEVQYVGPCHCSGERARSRFEKHFGRYFINVGAGKVITLTDLQ